MAAFAGHPAEETVLSYLSRWQAETGSPGASAAVAVNGKIVFSGGVGLADVENAVPQNARSVHNIGSVSKTQSVVALLQLVEQGKVRLDAQVQTYVPWFPEKGHPVTVRQILTHTSGIRHYKRDEFAGDATQFFRHYKRFEESTHFWRDDPLVFEPGTRWMYSSFATNLIQGIVEAVSGQGFEEYLTEHVWRPAGMADTRFDVPARIVPRRNQGYQLDGEPALLQHADNEDPSYKYAGGGMISTDEDLCRFGVALNDGRLLKAATLAEMYRLQLPRDIRYSDEEEAAYAAEYPGRKKVSAGEEQGLIFSSSRDATNRIYAGHNGSVKGTQSRFTNYYKDNVVVALHFNLADADDKVDMRKATEAIAQLYFLPAGEHAK